jgi:hypothetical protein
VVLTYGRDPIGVSHPGAAAGGTIAGVVVVHRSNTSRHAGPTMPSLAIDVRITFAERSTLTCVFPGQRSASSRLDNCYSDYATTNAQQFMDLLNSADVNVVPPKS